MSVRGHFVHAANHAPVFNVNKNIFPVIYSAACIRERIYLLEVYEILRPAGRVQYERNRLHTRGMVPRRRSLYRERDFRKIFVSRPGRNVYAYVFEIIGEFGRAIPRMVVGGGRQDGFENFLIGSVPTGKLIYTDEFDRTTSFNIIIIVRFGAVNELYV